MTKNDVYTVPAQYRMNAQSQGGAWDNQSVDLLLNSFTYVQQMLTIPKG